MLTPLQLRKTRGSTNNVSSRKKIALRRVIDHGDDDAIDSSSDDGASFPSPILDPSSDEENDHELQAQETVPVKEAMTAAPTPPSTHEKENVKNASVNAAPAVTPAKESSSKNTKSKSSKTTKENCAGKKQASASKKAPLKDKTAANGSSDTIFDAAVDDGDDSVPEKPRQKRLSPPEKVDEHYLVITKKFVDLATADYKYKSDAWNQTKRELKRVQDEVKRLQDRAESQKELVEEAKKDKAFANRQLKEAQKRIKNSQAHRVQKEQALKEKLDTAKKLIASKPANTSETPATGSKQTKKRKSIAAMHMSGEIDDDDSCSDPEWGPSKKNKTDEAEEDSGTPKRSSGRDNRWSCRHCVVVKNDVFHSECEVCGEPRFA